MDGIRLSKLKKFAALGSYERHYSFVRHQHPVNIYLSVDNTIPTMNLSIPSINLACDHSDEILISEIANACEQWGFFQVTGHGVPPDLRAEVFDGVRAFFALPKQSKIDNSRTAENFWGYYDKELTKNRVDAKEIFDVDANLGNRSIANHPHPTPWPSELPEFEDTVVKWLEQCERLSQDLLALICRSLNQSPGTLAAQFGTDHTSFLRFNHYPSQGPAANADAALGIHPHTDAGALTVLTQDDVPGLQVRKGDNWHTVVPEPDAFIINIGDMMQVWSNDRFRAPEHRVLASGERARLSAPYFYNPSYEAICAPLSVEEGEAHYRPVSWQEFRSGRAAGDYADQGEEIQISWFRK